MKQKFILTIVDLVDDKAEAIECKSIVKGVKLFTAETESRNMFEYIEIDMFTLIAKNDQHIITLTPLS